VTALFVLPRYHLCRYTHLEADDDLNDIQPYIQAAASFDAGRSAYDTLVRRMLQVWDGLLGVAVIAWGGLRVAHASAEWSWHRQVRASAMEEEQDEWADTRRSHWETKWRLARLQKAGYKEVAKPLEPYVLVFIVFGVPAVIMSTTACANHAGDETLQSGGR
jgi:hypothetical protein